MGCDYFLFVMNPHPGRYGQQFLIGNLSPQSFTESLSKTYFLHPTNDGEVNASQQLIKKNSSFHYLFTHWLGRRRG